MKYNFVNTKTSESPRAGIRTRDNESKDFTNSNKCKDSDAMLWINYM